MVSRFVAQRQNDGKYRVWDHQTRAVAHLNSQIRYENLEFNKAIDAALELNGPSRTRPTPEPPQQVAQQQQPQPDAKKKE
jgi:hypothetical protein